MNEQRKNQRFDLKLPFEIIGDGTSAKARGETKNVSSAGVLFTSEGAVAVGAPIRVLHHVPEAGRCAV